MENHGLGTHNDKMCADSSTGNTPQFIRPIIWDTFEKKTLIICPLSMFAPTAVHLIFFFGHWVELHCTLTKFMAQFFSDDASNIVNFYKSFLFFKTFHILESVSRSKLSLYKSLGMRKIRNVPPKNFFFHLICLRKLGIWNSRHAGSLSFILLSQYLHTLQMFCLLKSQTNACKPNPKTTSSNFNR